MSMLSCSLQSSAGMRACEVLFSDFQPCHLTLPVDHDGNTVSCISSSFFECAVVLLSPDCVLAADFPLSPVAPAMMFCLSSTPAFLQLIISLAQYTGYSAVQLLSVVLPPALSLFDL